ncbi:MAG: DNA-protecting protein DprA [Planctomycetia bacterium]|nr:DNA-protecting protein DprA [Planctomycetia bacterium]
MPLTPEVRDLLALHMVPGLGPRLTAALLERFGSAAAVRQATASELQSVPHIGPKLARDFHAALQTLDVDAEVAQLERFETSVLAMGQPGYPAALAEVASAPPLLYVRGGLLPTDTNAVALVGSRHCTAYGRRVAERLAGDLARAGYTVISGLARGIDGAAHRGALQAGGRTLAVLAGGLSRIYPPEHADLAREVQASGALLTEATMMQQPLPEMFPARNRIISGLSRGVVIIEAAQQSGALITARHALEQGRDVFAVPGPVDSAASAGCLDLIRQGAKLVRGIDDLLEDLGGSVVTTAPTAATPPPGLDDTQRRVWEHLAGGVKHLDELAQQLELNVQQLSGALFALEMKKAVRRVPGGRYERT